MACPAADVQHQTEVAERGKDVMPFILEATIHVFTKTGQGGVQRVVAKNAADAGQTWLVRKHLQEIRDQFRKGDFSGPLHIHGKDMPGLPALSSASPGQLAIAYKEVVGGAELKYTTADPKMVAALHQWFGAQLSDHGSDARAGHQHHHAGMQTPPGK
ncbi:MAG: aspartate carbamoyltransferase [Lautropia sp.]